MKLKILLSTILILLFLSGQGFAKGNKFDRFATDAEVTAQTRDDVGLTPADVSLIMAAPGTVSKFQLDHNVELLNADRTVLITDKPIQWYDCNGTDRNVTLPAEATNSTDLVFTFYNDSDGAGEDLVIRDDTPTTLITIGPGQGTRVSCDGTSWKVLDDKGIKYDGVADTITVATLNTGQGNYELYAMNQDVESTDKPSFAGITTTADSDFGNYYALQLQNVPDLASKGAGYWFDGVDDVITVSDNANLDFGTGPFSILIDVNVREFTNKGSGWNSLFSRGKTGDTGSYGLLYSGTKLNFFVENAITYYTEQDPRIIENVHKTFVGIRNSGTLSLYNNGKSIGTQTGDPGAVDVTSADLFYIGSGENGNRESHISSDRLFLFNLALSADEVKALSSDASVPCKYIGASQAELMPNQVDRDFSGASAWADVDLSAYSETDDLTITANAAAQYCTCPVASAPTTIGKRYRMTFDVANIVSTWTIKSFDGTQTIGTVTANGSGTSIGWTATTTGGYRIVAVANDSSADFDNFTLTQIGCVLQLEQDGIGHNQWADSSGNELHGTVSGALPINLPANHQEKYVDLTLTGNSSFTLPMGYQIKSIIAKETAGNALTGGLDVGLSANGVEIVSGMAVAGSATVLCTLVEAGTIGGTFTTADDTIYFSDGDDNADWNSAELELRIQMQKLTLN